MKVFKIALSFLLAVAFLIPTATAANDLKMTPKEYTKYLLDLSDTNPEALGVADNFGKLSEDEQKAYLEFMYSEDYLNIIMEALSGSEMDTTFKFNGVEIPVTTEIIVEEEPISLSSIGTKATYRSSITATIQLSVFGWNSSTLETTLEWQHNGTSALQIYSVSQGHGNVNPALWITDKGTMPNGISSGKAYGISNFELRATGSAGFISHTVKHEVRASTTADAQQKMTTSHPMGGFDWQ